MKKIYQTKILYPEILWERPVHRYKSDGGRILVIAGSRGNQNEALLLCEAIFRSGTGIITLAFPEELKASYAGIIPSEMTLALPQTHSGSLARQSKEQILGHLSAIDLVLLGPGVSTNTETVQLVWELLPLIRKPLIIDDDGLRAIIYGTEAIMGKAGIEGVNEYFQKLKAKIIVTPNVSDLVQILNALGQKKVIRKPTHIDNHLPEILAIIREHLGVDIILKRDEVVLFNGKKLIIDKVPKRQIKSVNTDLLPGIVASFVAQNSHQPFRAASVAVYLNTLANEIAFSEKVDGLVSSNEVLQALPKAIKEAESKDN